jgi:YHS domain-containing protein
MKLIVSTLLLLTLGACASYHQKPNEAAQAAPVAAEVKNPAAYNGHCPMGLCLKKMVKGDEKYDVEYKGKRYIFSSPEARDKFVSNIDANIKKANNHWARNGERAQ